MHADHLRKILLEAFNFNQSRSEEFETRSCNCSSKYENFGCKLFVDLHLMACYVGKKIIK